MEKFVCPNCGTEAVEGAQRCHMCGQRLAAEEVVIRKRKRKEAVAGVAGAVSDFFKGHKLSYLIKNTVLLLISIALLAFSFLPIFKLDASFEEMGLNEEIEIKFSTIDTALFFFDSLQEMDEDDLINGDCFAKVEELTEELTRDIQKNVDADATLATFEMSPYQKSLTEDIFHYTLRGALQSEDVPAALFIILSFAFSLLYMLGVAALFVFAVLNFIFVLMRKRSFLNICLYLLFAIPALLFSAYFCTTPYNVNTVVTGGGTMTATAVLSIVLVFAFAAYLFISRLIERRGLHFRPILKNLISTVSAFVVICLAFAPVMTSHIKTVYANNTNEKTAPTSVPLAYFAGLEFSEDDVEFYNNYTQDDFLTAHEGFAVYTYRDVKEGKASLENFELLIGVTGAYMEAEYIPLFRILFVLGIVAVLAAGAVIMQNLFFFATGEKKRWAIITAKIVCLVSAAVLLAGCILYSLIIMDRLNTWDGVRGMYELSIAAGPIALAVFAILAACVPSKDAHVVICYDDETENLPEAEAPASAE